MSHKNPFWLPQTALWLCRKPCVPLVPITTSHSCTSIHTSWPWNVVAIMWPRSPSSRLDKWRTAKFHWVQGFGCRGWNQWLEAGWRQGMRLMLVPSLYSAVSLHELANKDCAIQRTVGCPHYRNCVSRYFQILYYRGTFRVPTIYCIILWTESGRLS